MKLINTLTITAALVLAAGGLPSALAAEGTEQSEGPPPGPRPRPALEHLLPPRVVQDLNLTADQKTKYAELEAAFKKDAEKWRAAHPPPDPEVFRKARESGDTATLDKLREQRKELMDTRRSYVDKFRASLTDEQRAKLDKELEQARNRRGPGPGPGGPRPGGPYGPKGDRPPPPED